MNERTRHKDRLPANYRVVFDVVAAVGPGTHLTTNDVFQRARKVRAGIGLSTVYRGLRRLRDLGLIDEIVIAGADSAVYEPASPAHAHFRCVRCERVEDVPYTLPARTLASLGERLHTHIAGASLTLHGECFSCSGR
jgi:Fur family transcriptional regulator, peroxide stress response regulator